MITITLYAAHNCRNGDPSGQQPMGRYSGQRAIDRATPICLAMLSHQDDLYAGVEETWAATPGTAAHTYWDVAFSDDQGNKLIHVIGDAESGAVRRVSRVPGPRSTIPERKTLWLSAQQAAECSRTWMHTLGFAEEWHLASKPHRGVSLWNIRLQANGMSAHLDLDPQNGTLIFADITPAR